MSKAIDKHLTDSGVTPTAATRRALRHVLDAVAELVERGARPSDAESAVRVMARGTWTLRRDWHAAEHARNRRG